MDSETTDNLTRAVAAWVSMAARQLVGQQERVRMSGKMARSDPRTLFGVFGLPVAAAVLKSGFRVIQKIAYNSR